MVGGVQKLPRGRSLVVSGTRVSDTLLSRYFSVLLCLPRVLQRQRSPGVPHSSRAVQAAPGRGRAEGHRDRLQGLREGRTNSALMSGCDDPRASPGSPRSWGPAGTHSESGPLSRLLAMRLETGFQSQVLLEDPGACMPLSTCPTAALRCSLCCEHTCLLRCPPHPHMTFCQVQSLLRQCPDLLAQTGLWPAVSLGREGAVCEEWASSSGREMWSSSISRKPSRA